MKKGILLLLLSAFFLGCKPKQQPVGTKLDNNLSDNMKGAWRIASVSFPGSDYIKINSFFIADSQCFVGSQWNFIPNNNKGDMQLNKSSCASFSSPITWYLNKDGKFVMKIINENKAKKVTEGFVLTLANQTAVSFQLIDKANVGGKMVDVVYQFEKLNQ